MRCRKHIEEAGRAEGRAHALSRLLDTRGTVREKVRRLYATVIMSTVLYAIEALSVLIRTRMEKDKQKGRRHGKVDVYLAQLLSGHGECMAHRMRMNKADSDRCGFCGQEERESERRERARQKAL